MAVIQYYGTGRRKTSTARVFLRPGKGAINVNDGASTSTSDGIAARAGPAAAPADRDGRQVRRARDGRRRRRRRQAGAIRLGIARALCEYNAELRGRLKKEGS